MAPKALNLTQIEFLEALASSKGNIAVACEVTGTKRSKHYYWKSSHNKYKERCLEITGRNVDLAETKLVMNVNKGDQRAIEYLLTSQGKDRGYGKKSECEEFRVATLKDEDHNLILDAVISYTEFNDVLLLLGIEQYQFVKMIDSCKEFKDSLKKQIGRMLFNANMNAEEGKENTKSLILRTWLNVLNDGMSFSTSTMMYLNILMGGDDYTYDDQFWDSPEGLRVCESLREYIIAKQDYLAFTALYFKRVLKKDLKLLPFHKILAEFYLLVYTGDRKRFICNLPVRHGKSEFLNSLIFFLFFMDPSSIALHSAYGETVLKPMRTRIEVGLNTDPFFKKLMNLSTPATRFNNTDFVTTEGGNYLAFTVNGQVTGRGGSAMNPDERGGLFLDDVNAPKWKGTQHMQNSNEIVTNSFLSRIPHLVLLNTQQRIDDGDLTGYLLEDSNTNPPKDPKYKLLICYIPFDKNEYTDTYYSELKRKYPNVDFFGYEQLEYGVINPSMAHYANKETCPEAWHIYLTQYQQIPTESADRLFNPDMFPELRQDEIGVDATTGHLLYLDRKEDGKIQALLLTIFFHIDTSSLSDETVKSDYTAISVFGVGVDPISGLSRAILFEQFQERDINIKQFELGFEGVARKWLAAFPRNDIRLAVEMKSAGPVAKTTAEAVISRLVRQYNVQSAASLDLGRSSGENKRFRGEEASKLLKLSAWFRYYPYDLAMAINTRFAQHGNIKTVNPNHWWHEARYELINFTGRDSSSVNDDCCEGVFDVSNKMIIDAGEWREHVTYRERTISEHNLVRG